MPCSAPTDRWDAARLSPAIRAKIATSDTTQDLTAKDLFIFHLLGFKSKVGLKQKKGELTPPFFLAVPDQ
jgi:hypothetical protein